VIVESKIVLTGNCGDNIYVFIESAFKWFKLYCVPKGYIQGNGWIYGYNVNWSSVDEAIKSYERHCQVLNG
jgi:hypothetical protein